MCAAGSPLDDTIGFLNGYRVDKALGPEARENDGVRHWLHELHWDDPRVLYNPMRGHRRQSSWNNSGHSYPIHHEGPDLWVSVEVPEGLHRVTCYYFNKDGHRGVNRTRDYLVELRTPFEGTYYQDERDVRRMVRRLPDAVFEETEVLATCRVKHFWGGVHQRFAVRGPGRYLLRMCRNDSFNVEVNAVMLDRLTDGPRADEDAPPWRKPIAGQTPRYMWGEEMGVPPVPETRRPADRPAVAASTAVAAEIARLLDDRPSPAQLPDARRLRLLALRAAAAEAAGENLFLFAGNRPGVAERLAEHLRYVIPHWTAADRSDFETKIRRAWRKNVKVNGDREPPPARPADPMG